MIRHSKRSAPSSPERPRAELPVVQLAWGSVRTCSALPEPWLTPRLREGPGPAFAPHSAFIYSRLSPLPHTAFQSKSTRLSNLKDFDSVYFTVL